MKTNKQTMKIIDKTLERHDNTNAKLLKSIAIH